MDLIEHFRAFAREAVSAAVPANPVIGKLGRCPRVGKSAANRDCAYIIHTDGRPAGYAENFPEGIKANWRADAEAKSMTAAERAAIERTIRQREADEKRKADDAASVAVRKLAAAGPVDPAHPYLVAKQVDSFGLRQIGNALMVPVHNTSGVIRTLQSIYPDGTKRFLAGGSKVGNYHAIGGAPRDRLLIAEGYATAASVYMATGLPTACAFDAGNLLPVTKALGLKFPNVAIILAADHDASHVGFAKATEAARAVNGRVVMPETVGQDFNDLHVADGLDAVRSAFGALA